MLIAFEGGDGSGKGTQIKLLSEFLKKGLYQVENVAEPGGTPVGMAIRDILLNRMEFQMDRMTETLLFSAQRSELFRKIIRPSLETNPHLIWIFDRTYLSTFAYQGYGRQQNLHTMRTLTKIAIGKISFDLVFYLDIDPVTGLARKRSQHEINRLDAETLDFHQRIRKGYLKMAKKDPLVWKILDASKPPQDLHEEIVSIVISKLASQ